MEISIRIKLENQSSTTTVDDPNVEPAPNPRGEEPQQHGVRG